MPAGPRSLAMRILRPGEPDAGAVRIDLFWLVGFALLLVATGIGLRDPWPADEPRFALIARDMVATHDWLIPRVGGDLYPDKPPLFFWLIALGLELTGSLRIAFLLPSLLAAIGCVILVYDLARRLWGRDVGLMTGLALLVCVQFTWQARQAQIDATLCFFTTMSLYGLLRHCLLGPQWQWYAIGWAAAGVGIITKGVGFLPLLVLLPYAVTRASRWQPRPAMRDGWRWLLGPVALLAAVSIWLVPMLLATANDPALRAYRDEILFAQTLTRYGSAWHHREPFWYFLLEVIPGLWLPFTALLPWLIPRWREDLRRGDLRIALPLAWVMLVVLFFSLSSGKRGVYVLPAVPALALAAGPHLHGIAQRVRAQGTLFGVACALAAAVLAVAVYLLIEESRRQELIASYGIDVLPPLITLGVVIALICLIARPASGVLAYAGALLSTLVLVSFWINPTIDARRSGAEFMRRVEAAVPAQRELGVVGYKEQYLLQIHRPIVTFGHARWREGGQEANDAALWLSRSGDRVLLADRAVVQGCFASARTRSLGMANRTEWFLIEGPADPACVTKGNEAAPIPYEPR